MITATVVAGSVAKQLNLGSIVALLVVGMALGPHSPRPLLTGHVEELQTIGEIGVILLLFLVGLETKPEKLSSMRRLFYGLGTAQYLLTAIAIAGLLIAVARLHWQSALIMALGLAMSSDAIAIASLEEHAESSSPQSRAVMAVVIYQCFMAIPVLAMIPLLTASPMQGAPVPMVFKTLEVCAAIATVYLFTRYALPKILATAARKYGIEAFTLIVIATIFAAAWVMDTVGLSNALGAFMVGMILSASVFAYQIKASVSSIKGLLLSVFFIAIGMSINLKEVIGIGAELVYYLPSLLLIKVAVVIALGVVFRLGFRASVLAGLLLAPFDEIAYIIFSSAHRSGLLTERAYAMGLTGISFSFIVSPVLINLGYKLVDRVKTETKPQLPLKELSKSIHDHVVVVGYSYVGRVICIMLERANIPFIAFERRLDRIAEAKKEKRKVYFGDVTSPAMMNALAISRARAVIVTTRDYSAAKQLISTVLHFHPNLKVMTAVPYLFQRDELRELGAAQVVALMPEGTLSFGKSVLGELGIKPENIDPIMNSLRAADYASIRGIGGSIPDDVPKDAAAALGKRD
jgi:glutathione-regulated potassium-efflux system ancillary protein KefC